jgi:hypothetical protein
MKTNRSLLIMLSLVFFSHMLIACGAGKAASFPTGRFLRSGTANYGLVFNQDGTFSVFDGGLTIVNGKYSVAGNIFTDESNDQNCPPMSFKYVVDGANLTFNYVGNPTDDPCDGRRSDFNNVTYTVSK